MQKIYVKFYIYFCFVYEFVYLAVIFIMKLH